MAQFVLCYDGTAAAGASAAVVMVMVLLVVLLVLLILRLLMALNGEANASLRRRRGLRVSRRLIKQMRYYPNVDATCIILYACTYIQGI